MSDSIFSYIVTYDRDGGEETLARGFLTAENFKEAIEKLCFWYGEKDLISIKELTWLDSDHPVIEVPTEEIFTQVKNGIDAW